jgi:hypothetical protein
LAPISSCYGSASTFDEMMRSWHWEEIAESSWLFHDFQNLPHLLIQTISVYFWAIKLFWQN